MNEPPLLLDYSEAAWLLGLSNPKPGETESQARARGANALASRVSNGRIPNKIIKRTGRRVQFIRSALIAWAETGSR